MSSYLKYIEHIKPILSGTFLVNGHSFLNGINDKLITKEIKMLINEKCNIFHKKIKYNDAPYEDIIGHLSSCKFINNVNNKDCGGYYSVDNHMIYYESGGLRTLYHELGHSIQAELGIFDKSEKILSKSVLLEQQCETINYYLMNGIYLNSSTDSGLFNHYFNEHDINFLSDWFENGVIKDDIYEWE